MTLEKDITFDPSLDRNELGSFWTLFEAVIERIYAPALNIKRLANPEMDYYVSCLSNIYGYQICLNTVPVLNTITVFKKCIIILTKFFKFGLQNIL